MSLMDVARGAYVRSPRLLRRSLAPFVALIPTQMKFGATYRQWRGRIDHARRDPAYASAQHRASLQQLIAKAHAGSPFYRDLIDRSLGHVFELASFGPEHLQLLPVLRKEHLVEAGDAALTVPKSQVDVGDTSGSNGERPFSFYLDQDRSAREMAFVFDTWSRTGFGETDAKAVLRGVGLDPSGRKLHEWDPALRELRLSAFPLTRQDVGLYLDLIDKFQVRYLYGYPSAIELLCRHMYELERRPKLPLLGILPISEPLHAHQRSTFARALGDVPVSHFYGLSEKTLFAQELMDAPGVYEFNPLYGHAELVDEGGAPITLPGEEGRLIGTGFLSTGMPFIRYDTEDRARLIELPSAANGQRLRVEQLIPRRKPGFLIAEDGNRLVTVDFTPDSPRFFEGIKEYQFYQDRPGHCLIRFIPAPGGTTEDALRIARDLGQRAQGRVHFTVEQVENLGSGRAGKRAFIDQRLDLAVY